MPVTLIHDKTAHRTAADGNLDKKILLIEFCDFERYPTGGLLTFCRHMMTAFAGSLALVGITTRLHDPVGKWFKKEIDGVLYDYFALACYNPQKNKHLVPDRLITFQRLRKFKYELLQTRIQNVFVQKQEILMAIGDFGYKNICYCFAGLENPLEHSRYWYARYFSKMFYKRFYASLQKVNLVLAAGNRAAIDEMIEKSRGRLHQKSVFQFPTRIDTTIFRKRDQAEARTKLNLSGYDIIITTTGRLNAGKGWQFMIDCFAEFYKENPTALFIMIGDGEDLPKIADYLQVNGLTANVLLPGKKNAQELAQYLNASNVYIMGSKKEGWSTTLLEAVACGVPVCTTEFSSAREIVIEGSGYVVEERSVSKFIEALKRALLLERDHLPQTSEIEKYAVNHLKNDLLKIWTLQ